MSAAKTDPRPVILITNDDGICPHSTLILPLARHLTGEGHDVVVCAPGENNSACGQRITIDGPLTIRHHPRHEASYTSTDPASGVASAGSLRVFSIDEGTPSDCVIIATEPNVGLLARYGMYARLVLSGINVGQNLGNDVLYSGTFSAARQAAMYGIPGIAVSLDVFTRHPHEEKHAPAVAGALRASSQFVHAALAVLPQPKSTTAVADTPPHTPLLIEMQNTRARDTTLDAQARLVDAFSRGDIAFNVNIPVDWDGTLTAASLDCILYRSTCDVANVPWSGTDDSGADETTTTVRLNGKDVDRTCVPGSDVAVLRFSKSAPVSTVSTWPVPHARALPDEFFNTVTSKPTTLWDLPLRGIESVAKQPV